MIGGRISNTMSIYISEKLVPLICFFLQSWFQISVDSDTYQHIILDFEVPDMIVTL